LSEQITDKAIDYIKRQKTASSDKPFFLYYAPGATHAPHQVAKKWRDEYKGKFDEGWDVYREKVFAQQKKQGIIPANAVLPDRDPRLKAWKNLSADEKKLYARFFETYAAYLTYTDYEIGRVVQTLRDLNQLDNTAIFVIIGDNGASKEGDLTGVINGGGLAGFGSVESEASLIKKNLEQIDIIGEPEGTNTNYPVAWSQAANVPFRFWKSDANAEGGTHNPLIVHYPKGITEKGGIRNQYGHVIDILPTTLDILGFSAQKELNGVAQIPVQGTSLAYSFNDKASASKHNVQYYYFLGSGAVYKDGWKAAFASHPDAIDARLASFKGEAINPLKSLQGIADSANNPQWELYNLDEDFNERIDLAKKNPAKLEELKAEFYKQAEQNKVYPLLTFANLFNLSTIQDLLKEHQNERAK
jgi:arylsulfatase